MRAFFCYCIIVLAVAGCSTSAPTPPVGELQTQADYEAALARLFDQIDTAIGEARADDLAQCRLLEVGARPCGGPAEYRAFSSVDGDPERVLALTAAYNARNAEMNERFELVSTCEYREPPPLAVEGGRCVTSTP